ncbi:MAG: response regulator transcription factor [Chloroflexi bacterium]|nr:response regulator transcription factor [Chloroflexota bacterium]
MRLLLVSPDLQTAERLRAPLADKGVEVQHSAGLEPALKIFRQGGFRAVMLEDLPPTLDGQAACQAFRRCKRPTVLLVASHRPRSVFRIAEHHFHRPITARKLLYRIRQYLAEEEEQLTLQAGDLNLDVARRILTRGEQDFHLTPKECFLLALFMRNPGRVFSRKVIMKQVWDTEYVGDTRTLDVHVHWLRRKIEDDSRHPTHLVTVRGTGYRFEPVE